MAKYKPFSAPELVEAGGNRWYLRIEDRVAATMFFSGDDVERMQEILTEGCRAAGFGELEVKAQE